MKEEDIENSAIDAFLKHFKKSNRKIDREMAKETPWVEGYIAASKVKASNAAPLPEFEDSISKMPEEDKNQIDIQIKALDFFSKSNKNEIIFDKGWMKIFEAGYEAASIDKLEVVDSSYGGLTGINDYILNNGHVIRCRPDELPAELEKLRVSIK